MGARASERGREGGREYSVYGGLGVGMGMGMEGDASRVGIGWFRGCGRLMGRGKGAGTANYFSFVHVL